MEAAIEKANQLCPADEGLSLVKGLPLFNVTAMIGQVFNTTGFDNPVEEVPRYLCRYTSTITSSGMISLYLNSRCLLLGVLLGFPSSLFSLFILRDKEFANVSFMYHRGINALELIHTLFLFLGFLYGVLGETARRSFLLSVYFTYFFGTVDGTPEIALDLIILWMSVERGLMCHSLKFFDKVNQRGVAFSVMIGFTVVAIIDVGPSFFLYTYTYDNNTGKYQRQPSHLSGTDLHIWYLHATAIISYVITISMIIATVVTITGFVQMSKRKMKLVLSGGIQSASSQQLLKQIALNRQLCLLQVCEIVPSVLLCIIEAITRTVVYTVGPKSDYSAEARLSFEQANRDLTMMLVMLHLMQVGMVVKAVAHSTHFFRYIILSSKIRKAVMRKFRKGGSVSQS